MYIFQSSFIATKDFKDGYRNIDLRNTLMSDILSDYLDGYLTFTHLQLRGTFYMSLEELRATTAPMVTTMTLTQWLTYLGSVNLGLSKDKPIYHQRDVMFSDAARANFKVDRVGRHLPLNANISNADRVDLLVRKNVPNQVNLYKRMLCTVNGYLHRTYIHSEGVGIDSGGETFNVSGINTVGILSFEKACDVRQVAIVDDMITPTSSTIPLYNDALVNLRTNLTGKTVIICIAGIMYINSGVLNVVNPEAGIISLKLSKLDIPGILLRTVGNINLDALGVFTEDKSVNYNKLRLSDVTSDICIRKLLTLPQSFAIILDADYVQTTFSNVNVTGLPSTYESRDEPTDPMVSSYGLIYDYWKIKAEDHWSIKLSSDVSKRHMYKSNISYTNTIINGISPTHSWYYDDPKLMKITVTSKK